MNAISNTFENTLSGLSQGLQVRHIATFDLETCAPDEVAAEILKRYPEYDQIPVKDHGRVIGVLERNGTQDGLVSDQMHRLDDGILVSADESLLEFITLMRQHPYYRLILQGTQIQGIVTRSDVLKLPVRLLGFAMVTYLELLMKEIISQRLPADDAWLALLSEGRVQKVVEKQARYQEKRMEPPLLELTEFCDKKTILKKHFKLPSNFERDLKKVEDMRNKIAHAANYAADEPELQTFILNLQKARYWIEELRQYLD